MHLINCNAASAAPCLVSGSQTQARPGPSLLHSCCSLWDSKCCPFTQADAAHLLKGAWPWNQPCGC